MSFIADKQTLEDLNLLGKYKQHSIFSLFNKVQTTGGERLLSKMFENPMTDHEAINSRSTLINYFENKQISFPFSNEQFSFMENYLSGSSAGNYPVTLLNMARKKLLAAIVRDEEYPKIQSGLQHSLEVLQQCKIFINQLSDQQQQHPFFAELLVAKNILNDPRLPATAVQIATQSSLGQVAKNDHLLRHTMRSGLTTVMETFYQLDVYIAVAKLAKEKDFSYAKALPKDNHLLNAVELRHPNIEKAVANPVSLHQERNMVFLTGANMAGKSTFMKSFGINVYLAHMGFPVAAKEMIFSVKDGIYSSINVPDNLDMGYSHFYAEVLRVKKVAEEVNKEKNLVIIFDELFKGTNVKDAYDATLAVTAAFSAFRNCLFIISTHIIEAGVVLQQQQPNIQMLYLPTVMNGNIPTYTYRLASGISSDRHGMMIIVNEGILEMLK
ncbi:MutS-related protein [Pedobacter nutrimenti]|uniref:MutS-related protein n=1 Tax=Pedobacter nutrimenti TaxID=1241337 RepID=UPI002930B83A|nr:DNA mismatch repair protein [Pedobacter nutrimenti]